MTQATAWLPSADRTIPIFPQALRAPRGRAAPLLPRVWPPKAPLDMLDFTIDCTRWVDRINDSLATAMIVATPSDLAVPTLQILGSSIVAWLSGGTPGANYTLAVTLTSALGQQIEFNVALAILNIPIPAMPAGITSSPALTSDQGIALTADDGTVLTP